MATYRFGQNTGHYFGRNPRHSFGQNPRHSFGQNNEKFKNRHIIFSLVLFLIIAALFCYAFTAISKESDQRHKENLENALNRGIVRFYAVEGRYPADLQELKDNCPIVYDSKSFYVDYRIQGANIFPDVTVIECK